MPQGRKSTRRPAAKKPASQRRGSSRPTPSFRLLAFTLAIPFIVFAAWVTWVFITDKPAATETAPKPAVEASAAAAPLETTDVVTALQRTGIASNRIIRNGKRVSVESVDGAATVARRLEEQLPPDVSVHVKGSSVELSRGEARHVINVEQLEVVDSGAGLVEAEEGEPAEPASAEPPPAVRDETSLAPTGAKRIALILDDVGFANQPLVAAAALDAPISFAIIPHTPNAVSAARMLNARGFELLCHLPMEPVGFPKVAPGEGAILTSMTTEEINRQTIANLRSVPHISGVNNHMGSRATEDPRVMRSVLRAVRNENFFFVDSRTSAKSVGSKLARELDVRTVARDVFLDDSMNEAAVRAQVRKLAELAQARGVAVGIGHVYPVTIRVLSEELPKLKARGFTFVRASEVVR